MNHTKKFVVVGIGTDIGKTVVSAVLCEALQANYWKPVQAGTEPQTDTERVREMISDHLKCFPEHLVLKSPESPHSAAEKEEIEIIISHIHPPEKTYMPLIIEGAGG
ncbi:MAG: ATP-dependent dethiobiotin synthetase BioD, partial [Flavobacteriales bacterium]